MDKVNFKFISASEPKSFQIFVNEWIRIRDLVSIQVIRQSGYYEAYIITKE